MLRAQVEDMARICTRAVDVKVGEKHVRYESAGGRIWTEFRVRVLDTWVGRSAKTMTVRVPGGTVGNLSQDVRGSAELQVGRRYVLFLWKDKGGYARVLGLGQGAFEVTEDAKTGKLSCRNAVAGLALVSRTGRRVGGGATRLPYDDLKRRVETTRTSLNAERQARAERRLRQRRARARRHADRLSTRPGGE